MTEHGSKEMTERTMVVPVEPAGWIGYWKCNPVRKYYGFFLPPLKMDSFEEREIELFPVYGSATDIQAKIAKMRIEQLEPSALTDHLKTMLLDGTKDCPLCGKNFVHEHSANEIVIYKNGVKYGRSIA